MHSSKRKIEIIHYFARNKHIHILHSNLHDVCGDEGSAINGGENKNNTMLSFMLSSINYDSPSFLGGFFSTLE